MSDIGKIVLGAVLGAGIAGVIGYINYYLQFERNKNLGYKEKVKVLNNLLNESFDFIKTQLSGFDKILGHLPGNEHHLILLDSPPFQALKYLQDRLLLDDYYIAFTRFSTQSCDSKIMLDATGDFEKVYYRFKHDSIFLHTIIEQMDKFYTESYSLDFDRRELFYKKYFDFKREIITAHGKNLQLNNPDIFAKMVAVILHIDANTAPFGDPDKMIEINKGVKRINDELDNWESHLIGLKFLASDINSLYDEIRIKNSEVYVELKKNVEQMVQLNSNLKAIKESKLWKEIEKMID